ncbi:MAG: hypothetical protein ACXABY_09300 [Candidatus Thorarchaeota archaeon]|jgi:predicted RNase H-like nuclease (RuvC/YqgF family)
MLDITTEAIKLIDANIEGEKKRIAKLEKVFNAIRKELEARKDIRDGLRKCAAAIERFNQPDSDGKVLTVKDVQKVYDKVSEQHLFNEFSLRKYSGT